MNKETVESKAAETILQTPLEVVIDGKKYQVAPPSTGTLIMASKYISHFPAVKMDSDNVLLESLAIAEDCQVLGDVIAVLMLGVKNLTETRRIEKRRLWGLRTEVIEVEIDRKAELSKIILENLTPSAAYQLTMSLLSRLEIQSFFSLTSSLTDINMLKRTKRELEAKITASGR